MNLLVLRLAVALGFRDLRPLSEGQVRAILRRWARLRTGTSRGNTDLGMPYGHDGPTREPAWLLWCGTIDAKLGRLPRHTTTALRYWECSGPECEAIVGELVDEERSALWVDKARAARSGAGRSFGAAREAELRKVEQALGELVRSRAYAVAMEALRWELADAMQDQSFERADRMLQEREG